MVNTNSTLSLPLSRVSLQVSHCMLLPLQQNEWRFLKQGWKISCNYYNYCQYMNKRRPQRPSRKRGRLGRRKPGIPHYNCVCWFEVGNGYSFRKARRCSLGGSGTAAAIALWAACSGLQIQDSKQKKPSRKPSKPLSFVTAEPLFMSSLNAE